MKTIEILVLIYVVLTGSAILKMSYLEYNRRYKSKLLLLNPNLFYNQQMIYVDEHGKRFNVKLLFHFSDKSYAIQFSDGSSKKVTIYSLEII